MSQPLIQTNDEMAEDAKQLGLVYVTPRANELLLDLDEPYEAAVIKWNLHDAVPLVRTMKSNGIRIVSRLFTRSKSGNAHLYIRLSWALEDKERILFQALFRSDPVRDFLCLMRVWNADGDKTKHTVALFETPEAAEEVRKWRGI